MFYYRRTPENCWDSGDFYKEIDRLISIMKNECLHIRPICDKCPRLSGWLGIAPMHMVVAHVSSGANTSNKVNI